MTSPPDTVEIPIEPLFRPFKKRKLVRRSRDDAVAATEQEQQGGLLADLHRKTDPPVPNKAVDTDREINVGDGDRLRRKHLAGRRGGVTFTAQQLSSSALAQSLAQQPDTVPTQEAAVTIANRFASQTGQVSAVTDKHMTAYIDAEMTRLKAHTIPNPAMTMPLASSGSDSASAGSVNQLRSLKQNHADSPQKQAATLGRLQEIDLGPEAQARNIALTEVATRKLYGQDVVPSQPTSKRVENIRMIHNGRSTNLRRCKRRGSEDLARDSLVEAILSEGRTEHVYEVELEEDDNDVAADERLAEQFQAEFIEQMEARNAQVAARAAKPPETTNGGKSAERDEYVKGPKLGGSRMQRAAMRERDVASKGGSTLRGNRF